MDAMTESMEDVDPCVDFQHHVCGRWFSHHARRPSYEQEIMGLFLKRIHQALLHVVKDRSPGVAVEHRNMAKLYETCLKFVEQEQSTGVAELLDAMNISNGSLKE
ncbi:uncharacterized protein LOC144103269 [Amblyomma americanum]